MNIRVKDPVSALTHFIGALLSLVAVATLVQRAYIMENTLYMLAFGIFGTSLVLLYTASTVYHIVERPAKLSKLLKRIDHMMIFILIAGTYTPVCLIPLEATKGNPLGTGMLVIIWCIAVVGILLKIVWLNAPRWLYTGQYIMMGWVAIFAIYPLFGIMNRSSFMWMLAGGIVYTVGGVIYATKSKFFTFKRLGFHDVFHIFVLGGSMCHYFMVLSFV